MSGSLLGPDQVKKINAAFPALVTHIRELLVADKTGVGLMRVHLMVETFDSDQMFKVFQELSFISPKEKLALVRAAIYEVMALDPLAFVSPEVVRPAATPAAEVRNAAVDAVKVFSPPQFKLNVATSNAAESAKTDTKPTPIVTSTHTPKIAESIKAGDVEQKAQQSKLDAAVAKLREASTPKIVDETPDVIAQEREKIVDAADANALDKIVASQTDASRE